MSRVQVLVRDLFGGIVSDQTSTNLPLATLSLSNYLLEHEGTISQVVVLEETDEGLEKGFFKLRSNESWFFLQNRDRTICLPEPPVEEDISFGEGEDFI